MRLLSGGRRTLRRTLQLLGTVRVAFCTSAASGGGGTSSSPELLLVQVVHRHGDRSPITPLADREFWINQRPSEFDLAAASEMTREERDGDVEAHPAAGDGVFGTLTARGLAQMQTVGEDLRARYSQYDLIPEEYDGRLVKCYSTDFPRTIQSASGLLLGL